VKLLPNNIAVIEGDTHISKWVKESGKLAHDDYSLSFILPNINEGDFVVDAGAFIGDHTIAYLEKVGASGAVYAFEPNPSTFKKLSDNVSIAQFKQNINLIASAVGNQEKNLFFHCDAAHNISHIIDSPNESSITVSVVTIDSILEENIVHGIKIDVEGFELESLQGSEAILKRYHPWLCVEFNTLLAKVNKLSDWEVHHYLKALGYVCRKFEDALDSSTKSILSDNIMNILCCKSRFYHIVDIFLFN
jgi:FkbM family methyltransferase